MAGQKKSTLQSLLEELARITGLETCLYDLNYFTRDAPQLNVDVKQRIHASPLCMAVKSSPDAWKKCIETEHHRSALAARLDRPILHTCHAGLTDLILPIKSGGRQIGAFFFGQLLTQPKAQQQRTLRRLSQKYHLALSKLTTAAASHVCAPKSTLTRYSALLQCVREYIEQAEELLALRRESGMQANGEEPISPDAPVAIEKIPIFFLRDLRPPSEQISAALRLMGEGYWKSVTQAQVARSVGLSLSQFSRRFRQETGMTFRHCLMRVRVDAASYLLKRSSLNVSQIASHVGYDNFSSLQRAFRKVKNMTPGNFIRRQAL
jgi:AraC-like DNA-binding protein/ligand-binding sensor protein